MERKKTIGSVKSVIAKDGFTDYSIYVSPFADESVKYAANELARIVKSATGADLPIVSELRDKIISLGDNDYSAVCGLKTDAKELNRHGFKIKSFDKNVVIVAASRTAIIYAMQRYLELCLGYMYYHWEEIRYSNELVFCELDVVDYPDFLNRDVFSFDTLQRVDNHIKLYNSGSALKDADKKYGEGTWWSSLHDQSMALQIVDYKVYRKKYPHWFFGKEGGKNWLNPQICYTEALYSKDEYDKGDFSEPDYDDGRHGLFWTFVYNLIYKYIVVETDKSLFQLGMSDNWDYCNCERCNHDTQKYTKSGVAIRFGNAVADEVEKWRLENCPEREIYLTMFAYALLVEPPVVKEKDSLGNDLWKPIDESVIARDNIIIRYAPILEHYMFPLTDQTQNPGSYNAINGWKTITKHFAVWDYRVDFESVFAPFPQWFTAQENIRLYKQMGVLDVFHQACRTSGGNVPFISMDNWVRSRMLWDSTLEYKTLANEFIDAFYGVAGDAIREYIDYLTEHYRWANECFGYKGYSHFEIGKKKQFYPLEFVKKVESIFAKGYAALENIRGVSPERYALCKKRFDGESLFYRYCKMAFYPNAFTRKELGEEAVYFKAAGEAVDAITWFNTFDKFWAVSQLFLIQYCDVIEEEQWKKPVIALN